MKKRPHKWSWSIAVITAALVAVASLLTPSSASAQSRGLGRGWAKVKTTRQTKARQRVIRAYRARPSPRRVRGPARYRGSKLSMRLQSRVRVIGDRPLINKLP